MGNRIRELRLRRGYSLADLGQILGVPRQTVSRLERGEIQLTEVWMRRFARALKVDLFEILDDTPDEYSRDVTFYTPEAGSALEIAIAGEARALFKVHSRALDNLDILPGDIALGDMSSKAIRNVKTGDIVVAEVPALSKNEDAKMVLRQFVEPRLLITNSSHHNARSVDIGTDNITLKAVIIAWHKAPRKGGGGGRH